MTLYSIDPTSEEIINTFKEMRQEEVDRVLESAFRAYLSWSRLDFSERSGFMFEAAKILRKDAGDLAVLMAHEMGKPSEQGVAELEKCAWVCEHYANHAAQYLANETVDTDAAKSFVAYRPLGVVLAVMPWNFPFWQVFRFAAPCLMAGNGAVLKHASNVQGCAQAIEEILQRAGFPDHLFKNLVISSKLVEHAASHHRIAAVTLTGSTSAGRVVAARAGKYVKKTVLELGGSDAYLVLEDADLEHAAEVCTQARVVNSGQSCIAAKRFIVVESVRARFEELFVERMASMRMGNPVEKDIDIGPLARLDLRDELHGQVTQSVKKGARLLLGGELPVGPGAFYPPTVLTDVGWGMPAYEEELFGPVAAIIPVQDEKEAIRVANDTEYGLGAAIFSRDLEHAARIAEKEIEVGSCFVNTQVRSDPRLPFGGVKQSGYGRELSYHGIREFVNVKTVFVG